MVLLAIEKHQIFGGSVIAKEVVEMETYIVEETVKVSKEIEAESPEDAKEKFRDIPPSKMEHQSKGKTVRRPVKND